MQEKLEIANSFDPKERIVIFQGDFKEWFNGKSN